MGLFSILKGLVLLPVGGFLVLLGTAFSSSFGIMLGLSGGTVYTVIMLACIVLGLAVAIYGVKLIRK